MRERLLTVGRVACVLSVAFCLIGGNDPKDKKYKGGEGDGVKGWGARDFESAKNTGQPICVYFYDPKNDRNMTAKSFEEVLGNAEVKEKLKGFLCLKVKGDCSDGKGWPGDWPANSVGGAALVVTTSDFAQKQIYHKLNKETLTGPALAALLKGVLAYEEQRKVLMAKAGIKPPTGTPGAPPPPEPKEPKLMPGLDTEKKAEEKKKPEKKKIVDGPAEE